MHTFFLGGFHHSQDVELFCAPLKWERKRIPDGFGGDSAEDRPGIEVVDMARPTFNPLEIITSLGQAAIGGIYPWYTHGIPYAFTYFQTHRRTVSDFRSLLEEMHLDAFALCYQRGGLNSPGWLKHFGCTRTGHPWRILDTPGYDMNERTIVMHF